MQKEKLEHVSLVFCRKVLPLMWKSGYWMLIAFIVPNLMAAGAEGGDVNLVEVNEKMVFWTWLTFGILLIILYFSAWKPILSALDKREKDIKDSVENAVKIQKELEKVEANREKIIREADEKAKDIVSSARKAAVEASKVIEDKAREEAKILLANANREIKAAREKAIASLRQDSATLAIELAEKLIGANLDSEKNKELTDRLIGKI